MFTSILAILVTGQVAQSTVQFHSMASAPRAELYFVIFRREEKTLLFRQPTEKTEISWHPVSNFIGQHFMVKGCMIH